jgi:D-aminopeptidase
VLLVAGDVAVAEEASKLLPHVTVCPVKRGLNRECAVSHSAGRRRELLHEAARESMNSQKTAEPLRVEPTMEITWRREVIAEQTGFIPTVERVSARTIRFRAGDMLELQRLFRVAQHIAARYPR